MQGFRKIAFVCAVAGAVFSTINCHSQEAQKTLFQIQTGFLGTWVGAEFPVTKNFILRAETGLDAGFFGGISNDDNGFVLAPVFTIEPRYYYNFGKRTEKGKQTRNNSGNFFGIKTSYHPDWFLISDVADVKINQQLTVIPKWGIRRNIGKTNFNYELGFGIGRRFYRSESETAADLHLRIGYTF